MSRVRIILAAVLWLSPAAAVAHGPNGHPADPNLHVDPTLEDCSVIFSSDLTQEAFGRFTREFGSTSAFKHMASPATLGKGGIEVSVEQMYFTVEEHSDAWNDTFAHPDAYHELGSDLSFPKFRLRVGVTANLDLGAYWTKNMNANYGWLGLEAKYALVHQTDATPYSVSVRGAYTKTLYVDDMDMHALSADVLVGRTFWNSVTPYLGAGGDLVFARETSDNVDLNNELQPIARGVGGVEVRLWHVAIGAEGELGALNRSEFKVSAMF